MRTTRYEEALETQLDLIDFFRHHQNRFVVARFMLESNKMVAPNLDVTCQVIAGELNRSETFWVTDEMAYLINEASQVMPNDVLRKTDLFSPNGFVVFDDLLEIPEIGGSTHLLEPVWTMIRAISWSQNLIRPKLEDGNYGEGTPGIAFITWQHADDVGWTDKKKEEKWFADAQIHTEGAPLHNVDDIRATTQKWVGDRLFPLDLSGWQFDASWSEGNWDDNDDLRITEVQHPGMAYLRRLLLAFFRIASERIMLVSPSRKVKRRWLDDIGTLPNFGDVKAVTLRRGVLAGSRENKVIAESEGREYSHRFFVRGHWRNQWYPSEEVHKQKWIDPYVKGPPNLPLIQKDKIFKVER